jgi:hypothetical protein
VELPLTVAWKQAPTLSYIPPKRDSVEDKVRGGSRACSINMMLQGFAFKREFPLELDSPSAISHSPKSRRWQSSLRNLVQLVSNAVIADYRK